jgi:hypothetical protein
MREATGPSRERGRWRTISLIILPQLSLLAQVAPGGKGYSAAPLAAGFTET